MDTLIPMDTPILIALAAVFLTLGILFLVSIVRLLWRKPKRPPLTPEEKAETNKLRDLLNEVAEAQQTLNSIKSQCNSKSSSITMLNGELEKIKAQVAEAKAGADAMFTVCHSCNQKVAGNKCPKCGSKTKPSNLQYKKIPWTEVSDYLHQVTEWGEPSELDNDPTNFLLPWPTVESVSFTVGGLKYEWGKMEDEDHGGNDWWAFLEYEHPILGQITLINNINSDGDHIFRDGENDDEILSQGDYSDLRSDIVKGLKQGLTALYIWLKADEFTQERPSVPPEILAAIKPVSPSESLAALMKIPDEYNPNYYI